MKYSRSLTLAALTGVMVVLAPGGPASAECKECSTLSVSPPHTCYQFIYNYHRHKAGDPLSYGYDVNHSSTNWWCGSCEVHRDCQDSENPPVGGEEEEVLAAFHRGGSAKLLAAARKLGADAFVEHSSGRLVVLNCRGHVTHQYKLTSDQIAILSAATEHVAAAEE